MYTTISLSKTLGHNMTGAGYRASPPFSRFESIAFASVVVACTLAVAFMLRSL